MLLLLRWTLVAFIWLGWLPYCTRHIWRNSIRVGDSLIPSNATTLDVKVSNSSLMNATMPQTSQDTFLPFLTDGLTSSRHINKLLLDIMEGQVITSIIIVIFVVVFLIREWILRPFATVG